MSLPLANFRLDSDLPYGLQAGVREMIASAILNRMLQPGEKLPSSRKLADHLGLARNTVIYAYKALADDGYLETRERSGYYVSPDAPAARLMGETGLSGSGPASQLDWSARLKSSYDNLSGLHKPLNWREYRYPFVYGQTDQGLFNHSDWRDCARQALGLRDFGATAGDYGLNDDPMLADYIRTRSLPRRGIVAEADEILVTLGAQNALYLLAQLLVGRRTGVVIEDPAYPDLRDIMALRTSQLSYAPVDNEGMILDEEQLAAADLVVITPSHQCPTNVTMSRTRRQQLLALARQHDFIIIEDDYEFEMNFIETPAPALKSEDRDGRTIYVGSFSKSLFPGLRLGYMVAPAEVIRQARALRHLMFRHPPGHAQRTTAYFLALGHYDAQLRKLRRRLAERRMVMAAALRDEGLIDSQAAHFGGTSFWLRGPEQLDTGQLAARLAEQSVLVEPGRNFFAARAPHNTMRLAYSSIEPEHIGKGIHLVAEAIRQNR